MFERLSNALSAFKKSPTGVQIEEDDVAYAANALMMSGAFQQYNPDDLIGRKGWAVYKKMMQDEQVKAVVRFRRDAVTGRNYEFEDHPDLSEEENDARRQILKDILDKMQGSFKTRLDMIMSSLYNGFSMVEKSFELVEIDGKHWAGIKSLRLKPFHSFYFNLDDFGALDNIEQQIAGYIADIDIKKFVHHVANPDIHEYYGQSELREAYRAWWSKDTAIKLQNIYLERAAAGFLYAVPTGGTVLTSKSPEYANIKNVLSTLRSNSAVLFPSGLDVNMVHPSDTQAFDRAIVSHDKSIAKALLMPNLLGLSEQGANGSRALGDTQLEAFLWLLDAEAQQLEETVNEQLFKDLAVLNWPDGLYPAWRLKQLSNKQQLAAITQWKDLLNGKAVRATEKDEDHVRATLGFPEFDEDALIVQSSTTEEEEPKDGEVDDSDEDSSADDDGETDDDDDETIVGTASVRVSAEMAAKKAVGRVDFKVIDAKSDDIRDVHVPEISSALTVAVSAMLEPVLSAAEVDPDAVKKLKFGGRDKTKINNKLKAMLRDGWMLGTKHARDEIAKATGKNMSVDFQRIDEMATDFFNSKAFTMTGKLTGDMLSTAQNTLLQSIKNNESVRNTVDEIYKSFAAQGFITSEDAEAQMAGILTAKEGATARLNTVVRTNSFEALNEARYTYFTDPEIDGFVEALEYSAILDSATTQICQHLDGHVHAAEGEVWNGGYRPPNHFNCRSLLVPVTRIDTWEESASPEMTPQEGFK